MRFASGFLAAIALLILAALAVSYSGIVNVAATESDNPVSAWSLSNTMQRSVRQAPEGQRSGIRGAYVREGILTRRAAVDPTTGDGQGSPHALVERVESLVDEAGRRWARQMADQTLASFEARVFQPPPEQTALNLQEQLWETLDRECRE